MDIGDERNPCAFSDNAERSCGVFIRHSKPHDLTTGLFQIADLIERLRCVSRVRVAHGLDSDRSVASDLEGSKGDLFGFFAGNDSIHDIISGSRRLQPA
jgi:hypothetical protein